MDSNKGNPHGHPRGACGNPGCTGCAPGHGSATEPVVTLDAWGLAPEPTPARRLELDWSSDPSGDGEPWPTVPPDPKYTPTTPGRAQCPACVGAGQQYVTDGTERTCYLCAGDGETRRGQAWEFVKQARREFGPSDDTDYEEMSERRNSDRLTNWLDSQESKDFGIF